MKTKDQEETTLDIAQGIGHYHFENLLNIPDEEEQEEEEQELQLNVQGENPDESFKILEPDKKEEKETVSKEDKTIISDLPQPSIYSGLSKKYIEMGLWQDAKIELNGEEVTLSEVDDIDEETFLQIQQSQEAAKDADLKDKYINKEELDDISLQILEISKNRGDLSKVLDVKKRYIDPLEKFDLTQESHQEALVRQKYLIESNNKLSTKDLDLIIKSRKEDLTLDSEAQEYANGLKAGFKNFLAQEEERSKKELDTFKESVKNTRKSVRDELSKKGLNDAAIKPLLSYITEDSTNDPILQQILEIKKDPALLSDFLLFISNKEEYNKSVGAKATAGQETKFLKTLSLIPNKKETKAGKQEQKEEKDPLVLKYLN